MNLSAGTHRPLRQDGEQSRERLLSAALALFAQHGFAKTSTREIAEAAQTNIAAISYYFGDKAGLYRAAFFASHGSPEEEIARYADPKLSLPQALRAMYASVLGPLHEGEIALQHLKLHAREMIEPTGLWQEELATGIRPMHDALVAVLCRHFRVTRADDDLLRLAVCIAGLGVHMHIGRDVIDAVAPRLNARENAQALWSDRLVMYAQAMVAAEARRRRRASSGSASGATSDAGSPGEPAAASPVPPVAAPSARPAETPGASKSVPKTSAETAPATTVASTDATTATPTTAPIRGARKK